MAKGYIKKILISLAVIWGFSSIPEMITPVLALTAPSGHSQIIMLFQYWTAEKRKYLSRAACQLEGGWGQTTQWEKERAGILCSILDGKKRLITINSFYQHLITRVVLSHPVEGVPLRGSSSPTQFKPALERRACKHATRAPEGPSVPEGS
jgi:hypothetical protein